MGLFNSILTKLGNEPWTYSHSYVRFMGPHSATHAQFHISWLGGMGDGAGVQAKPRRREIIQGAGASLGEPSQSVHRIVEQFDPEPLSCTAGSGKNCFHEVLDVPSLMQGRGGSATTVDCWPQSRAVSTIWCSLGNADISGRTSALPKGRIDYTFQGDFPRRRNPERRGAANPPCMCNLAVFSRFSCLILAMV